MFAMNISVVRKASSSVRIAMRERCTSAAAFKPDRVPFRIAIHVA